jgi:hypothetical protein
MDTIELRPHGWARFAVAAFLSLWLVGWLAGELVVLKALLGLIGIAFEIPFFDSDTTAVPGDLSGIALVAFLVVWFVFWTFGGAAAIGLTLRMLFGRDVIELTPHGWTVRQMIGPLGRAVEFHRHDVTQVYQKRSRGTIVAVVKGRAVDVSSYGTPTERQFAVERIRAHAGIPAEPPKAVGFTDEWVETRATDGSIVYTHRFGGSRGCLAGCAVVGLACIAVAALPYFVATEERASTGFAVAGVVILAITLLLHTAADEWRIARGRLDVARTLAAWKWTKQIRDASLEVRHSVDDDGDEHAVLWAIGPDGEHRLLSRMNEGHAVAAIARRVAELTGWELTIDPGVEPR